MDLKNLITFAYSLQHFEVIMPQGHVPTKYNLNANVPEEDTKDDLKLMVQALLSERFKLVFHREPKRGAGI